MKNILLTAASGFIGSHLIQQLIKEYNVYAIVRHTAREVELPKEVHIIYGDLQDIHSLNNAVNVAQPEIVIHTAAITPVRKSFDNPFIYEAINYRGTMNLIHAALKSPTLEKFVHASTAETYRSSAQSLREDDTLFGGTPYGISKTAAELYVRMAGECFGLPYIILRPANTYGRKIEKGYMVEKIVTTMLTDDKLHMDGRPHVVRDLLYVDDHVNGYLAALKSTRLNRIYNLSTNVGWRISEVVELAAELLDWHGTVSWGGNVRPYDPPTLVLNNALAQTELDWKVTTPLRKGLSNTINYWGKAINYGL